jgi:hypothetical protein
LKAGAETQMLEFVNGGLDQLYADLVEAEASAWQRYGVADKAREGGRTKPGYLIDFKDGRLSLKSDVVPMAEIFRNVREGAVRIAAKSSSPAARALAFRSPDGGDAIFILADKPGAFLVEGLRPGAHAIAFAPKNGGARGTKTELQTDAAGAIRLSADRPGVIALTGPATH